MRHRKLRKWVFVALGVFALATASYIGRDVAVEFGLILRLRSSDELERDEAAEALVDRATTLSLPHLIESVRKAELMRWKLEQNFTLAVSRASNVKYIPDHEWGEIHVGRALASIGNPAIPRLVSGAQSDDELLSLVCFKALEVIGRDSVPSVLKMLRASDPEQRKRAAVCLARIRPRPLEAAPELLRGIKDSRKSVKDTFAYALSYIDASRLPIGDTHEPKKAMKFRLRPPTDPQTTGSGIDPR